MSGRRAAVAVVGAAVALATLAQVGSAAGSGMRSASLSPLGASLSVAPTPETTTTTAAPGDTTTTTAPASSRHTVTFVAVGDATVNDAAPSTADGASATLALQTKSRGVRQAYARFDLGSIPSGATVEAAALTVTRTGTSAVTFTVQRAAATPQWSESTLTWLNQPGLAGTAIPASAARNVATSTSDVTADVAAFVASPSWNNGWRLWTGSSTEILIHSRESATAAARPTLVVTYVAP